MLRKSASMFTVRVVYRAECFGACVMERRTFGTRFFGASAGIVLSVMLVGCHQQTPLVPAPIENGSAANGADPAAANMLQVPQDATGAPVQRTASQGTQVAGQSYTQVPTQNGENYPQGQDQSLQPGYDPQQQSGDDSAYENGADAYAQYVDNSVPPAAQAPPPLPVYEQPDAPGPNYLWTPGYWSYGGGGYYWVPGAWVAAPYEGALWTPGWWGYYGNQYRFHHGYWAPHVGFYGGINYGFGYVGIGYFGGYWNRDRFQYNQAVNHISPRMVQNNVYVRNVTINNSYRNDTRTSFYGAGGVRRPITVQERLAARQPSTPPMRSQMEFRQQAQQNRAQAFSQNHGQPATSFARQGLAADRGIQRPAAVNPAVLQQQARELQTRQQQQRQVTTNQQNQQNVRQQQQIQTRQGQQQQLQHQQVANQQAQRQQQTQANNAQRQQQANTQRQQQVQQRQQATQNVQRQQAQQRTQQVQQQQTQARQQQQVQQNAQRAQQNAQRVQQQNAQRQQQNVQRQQQQVQQNAQRQQQVQQQQVQHQQQVRPAPAAPARPAGPQPHAAPEGGGEHHH
ncbi:putative lipoprotein [Terriglobus saanensis SP1PR4]|uniref:Putative lipoprotein n=2 Tax=Terriglobus saanensis TaxID=870903 RepID=E8V212_TERSS|nr:putative lipoprotein [Terriglobus saanensis SP1PR4]